MLPLRGGGPCSAHISTSKASLAGSKRLSPNQSSKRTAPPPLNSSVRCQMDFESIRPALSGIIGGMVATWLVSYWSRRLPASYKSKSRQTILRQHRTAIWAANSLFFVGLFSGIALYWIGDFADTDHRPMLWAFGLASVLPLVAIGLVSLLSGRRATEAYVAFSWGKAVQSGQRMGF